MRRGLVDPEMFGVLCDVVQRAWMHLPVERSPEEAPVLHTSSYARAAAIRIIDELGLEVEDPRFR